MQIFANLIRDILLCGAAFRCWRCHDRALGLLKFQTDMDHFDFVVTYDQNGLG